MATFDITGRDGRRRPSFRGKIMLDVSNGQERVRKWPRGRGKISNPANLEQMEWFRQAQLATKFTDALVQTQITDAVKGTPLMPRDIMTMIMSGRFAMVTTTDGQKWYPKVALQDVSESLDIIGSTKGSFLYRGNEYWSAIPPGTDGQVLASGGPDAPPYWTDQQGGGGGGGMPLIGIYANDGNQIVVPLNAAQYYAYMVTVKGTLGASAAQMSLQVSADNGVTFFSGASDYKSGDSTASNRVSLSNGQTIGAGRYFICQFVIAGMNVADGEQFALTGTQFNIAGTGNVGNASIGGSNNGLAAMDFNAFRIFTSAAGTMGTVKARVYGMS